MNTKQQHRKLFVHVTTNKHKPSLISVSRSGETDTDSIQGVFPARLANRTKAIFHSFILILTTNSIIASTRVWGVTSAPRTC